MNDNIKINKKTAVALGNFDGVHLGHRRVLNAVIEKAADGFFPFAAVFDIHPKTVLSSAPPGFLCTPEMREKIFKELGVGLFTMNFSAVRGMDSKEFFDKILIKELNAGFVACGDDYRFAKDAAGNAAVLEGLCRERGVGFCSVPEQRLNGERISSTNIRKALAEGDIPKANAMLGREFSYNFTVVSGDRRGRLLGAPTINQFFPNEYMVPKYGVYASLAYAEGKWYAAVTNIGLRPTVGNSAPRSETCLLGFTGDLYGKNIEVCLVKYLREEKKFNSFDELSKQIKEDAESAKKILEGVSNDI